MTDKTRADFEAHIASLNTDSSGLAELLERDYTGAYEKSWVQLSWLYWQAATLAERERCAKEAEHWQTISSTPGHACGQYIAAAIRKPPTGTGGNV